MYLTSYTDYPEDQEYHPLKAGVKQYDDSISEQYLKALNALDRFTFLIDIYRIQESCTQALLTLRGGTNQEFWQLNLCLMNYLNAVYSYKEYINSYDPPLKRITENYYKNKKWYRFVCDYRNRVIHQSTFVKDWNKITGDIYIDLEEMICVQSNVIAELEQDKGKDTNNIENAKRFLNEIKSIQPEEEFRKRGKDFTSLKNIAYKAALEIAEMQKEILDYAYSIGVAPIINWLIENTYKAEGKYWYTFIYNEERYQSSDPRIRSKACFEPNTTIENFFYYILKSLGKDNEICKSVRNLLRIREYNHIYDKHCTVEEYWDNPYGGFTDCSFDSCNVL